MDAILNASETATGSVYEKKVFKKILQNSQESFRLTLFKQILRHKGFPVNFATLLRTPFYRTPPVAATFITKNANILKVALVPAFLNLLCVSQVVPGNQTCHVIRHKAIIRQRFAIVSVVNLCTCFYHGKQCLLHYSM